MLCNKRSHSNEKPMQGQKSSPCSPQLEKACMQQWRPSIAKNKYINNSKTYLHILYKPFLVMMNDPFYTLLTLICMWVSFLVLPVSDFSIKVKLLSESKSSLFLLLLSPIIWKSLCSIFLKATLVVCHYINASHGLSWRVRIPRSLIHWSSLHSPVDSPMGFHWIHTGAEPRPGNRKGELRETSEGFIQCKALAASFLWLRDVRVLRPVPHWEHCIGFQSLRVGCRETSWGPDWES